MTIFRNGSKIASAFTEGETKKATIRLLRTIILLTQTLKSLPDEVMMTMKLLYYDDDTPADYQPPGFKESLSDSFAFLEDPMNIKVGDVSTPFHTVKLRIRTDCHQFEVKEDEEEDNEEEKMENEEQGEDRALIEPRYEDKEEQKEKDQEKLQQSNGEEECENITSEKKISTAQESEITQDVHLVSSEVKAKPDEIMSGKESEVMECEDTPLGSPNIPGASDTAAVCNTRTSTPVESQLTQDHNEHISVKCACGYNEDDGLMILCGVCDNWQHAVCFGILEEEEAPELHICVVCAKKEEKKCTDPLLTKLDPVNLQATSLWRRALLASTEMNRILPTTLARRLGTEMTVASGLLHRLEKEGFVKSALKGKRLGKIVNKGKVKKESLKKYFSGTPMPKKPDSNTADGVIRATENKGIENIVKKASEMDVSGKLKPRTPKLAKCDNDAEMTTNRRKSQRIAKRAISLVDKTADFEISNSQDTYDDNDRNRSGSKRRKASVAAQAILV